MSVDLGAVVARVVLEDVGFQAAIRRDQALLREFGTSASRSAAGTAELDGSLNAVSASASKTGASLGRAAKASTEMSVAEQKAATAAVRHAAAVSEVSSAMNRSATAGERVQVQTLRQVAAQERLAAASADAGTAEQLQARETARLASAQASAISATRALTTAQKEGAASAGFFAGRMGGLVKTAGELGLVFGAFEAIKKTIDIGREAGAFQQNMLLIQTNAGASADEVKNMSAAVLAMSGPLATAPDKLADALYHVEQNGLRGRNALDALTVGAQGAKIGMADVEDTTNTMTIAMASGIKGVANLQQAMGFMIATVGTGDMRLKDLNEALSGGILSVAKGFGGTLRDVAAILATLGDNGIRGADAATALRMVMMGFAQPAKAGADALRSIGLGMTDLRDAMEKHGVVYAMNDLEKHMTAAGITGGKVGAFITQAFGKRAGAGVGVLMGEIDRLNTKWAEAQKGAQNFGERWAATTKTASFQFHQLGAAAQAEGIRMATAVLPLATLVAGQLGGALHDIIHVVGEVGAAFAPVFQVAGVVIAGAAYALHGVAAALSAIAPVLKVVAAAWAGMFLGQAAARAAVGLIAAVGSAFQTMQIKALYAQDAVAAGWARMGGAAGTAAAETGAAAAVIGAEAEGASATVVASGEAAEAGWAGLAGPIGAAALGVFAIVSLFHRSTSASKEATNAAKAYSEALSSGGKSDLVDSIKTQLSDAKLPDLLKRINDGLGRTAFTGAQFVTAISQGGKPLDALRTRLEGVVTAGTRYRTIAMRYGYVTTKVLTPAAQAAAAALGHLNTQYNTLTKTAAKDLLDTKTFAGAAGAIQKTTVATKLGTDAAKQYATMAGLVVDKNGIVAASQAQVNAAVGRVADAYATATQAGSAYLTAVDAFSKSAGTSADRAALIGATLQAANGDALGYVGAMSAAAGANHDLVNTFRQQRQAIGQARAAMGSAKAGTREYAQAQQQLKDALHQSEKAAIDLKTGTINYRREGAGPLVQQLQAIQSAAMSAASATFQHARATEGAKQAADDAYKVYVNQTRGSLMDEATQLGLTHGQAKKLADAYFGMPKNVKTQIETAGVNPVLDVLNRIGKLLANLTGQPWEVDVTTVYRTIGQAPTNIGSKMKDPRFAATGGAIYGPGTATSDSIAARLSNGEHVWTAHEVTKAGGHAAVYAMRAAARAGHRVPGFASGGAVANYGAVAAALRALGATRAGIAGFLGNTAVESGGSTRAHNGRENAWGLQQWEGGRLTELKRLAARMHVSFTSQAAQVAMITSELTHGYRDTLRVLRTSHNARAAAAYVDGHYERSAGTTRREREQAAAAFARGGIPASGGGITTGRVGGKKVWIFGGQEYVSLRAAQNAEARAQDKSMKQRAKAVLELRSKDLGNLWRSLTGTTSQLIRSEKALNAAARQAGVSSRLLDRIHRQEGRLNVLSRQRNHVAALLGAPSRSPMTAWQQLEAARSNYTGERNNVRSTIAGGFDLAQAGRSSGTGVTLASIMGDARQQRANAELFDRQLHKLQAMGLGKQELQQLAEKGFAGAESSTLALLGGSRKQLRTLNGDVAGLNTAAGQTGTFAAELLYGKDVRRAKGRVESLEAREKRIDLRMERVATTVATELARNLRIEVNIGGEKIDERVTHRIHHEHRKMARDVHRQAGRA